MSDIKEAQGLEVVGWRVGFQPNRGYKGYDQRPDWAYRSYGDVTYEVQELCRLSDATAVIDQQAAELAYFGEQELHLRSVIDQLRAANGDLQLHFDTLKADYEALKSATVVMPDRRIQALAGVSLFDLGHAKGWNACLDELARLNRSKT